MTPKKIIRKEKPLISKLIIEKATARSIKIIPQILTVSDRSKFINNHMQRLII